MKRTLNNECTSVLEGMAKGVKKEYLLPGIMHGVTAYGPRDISQSCSIELLRLLGEVKR